MLVFVILLLLLLFIIIILTFDVLLMEGNHLKCANEILRHFIILKIYIFCIDFIIHPRYGRVIYTYIGFIIKSLLFVSYGFILFMFYFCYGAQSKKYGNLWPTGSPTYIHVKIIL